MGLADLATEADEDVSRLAKGALGATVFRTVSDLNVGSAGVGVEVEGEASIALAAAHGVEAAGTVTEGAVEGAGGHSVDGLTIVACKAGGAI